MVVLGCPVSNVLPDLPVTKIQSTAATVGHHQLFSPLQSTVKVSTALVPGFQNHELNRSS